MGYTRIEPIPGGAARLDVMSELNSDEANKVTDGRGEQKSERGEGKREGKDSDAVNRLHREPSQSGKSYLPVKEEREEQDAR